MRAADGWQMKRLTQAQISNAVENSIAVEEEGDQDNSQPSRIRKRKIREKMYRDNYTNWRDEELRKLSEPNDSPARGIPSDTPTVDRVSDNASVAEEREYEIVQELLEEDLAKPRAIIRKGGFSLLTLYKLDLPVCLLVVTSQASQPPTPS